jgi:pimeloyl-ACP methyl ester carboxylesterase
VTVGEHVRSLLPWPAGPRVRARQVAVEGVEARLLEAGAPDAPPLVLLASMLVRARTYRPLVRRLARHFRVVAVELPGSGQGARLREPWSLGAYADYTGRLLEGLQLGRPPVVVGHSNSGPVALLLAAARPAQVAALVLVDSVGARRRRSVPRVVLARLRDGLFEPLLNLRAGWHLGMNVLVHARSFFHQVRVGAKAHVLAEAAGVAVPTLVAWGRNDRTVPPDCAWRFAACLPRARVVLGPGSHDWLNTAPESFTRALLAFCRRAALLSEAAPAWVRGAPSGVALGGGPQGVPRPEEGSRAGRLSTRPGSGATVRRKS